MTELGYEDVQYWIGAALVMVSLAWFLNNPFILLVSGIVFCIQACHIMWKKGRGAKK